MIWTNNDGKYQARHDTIITPIKQWLGHVEGEYWTLAGMQVDENGQKNSGSEIEQLLAAGVLTEDQFFGVDYDKDIIEANRKAYPNANWFCGDFFNVLTANADDVSFINFDSMNQPRIALQTAIDLLFCVEEGIVIANMLTKYRNQTLLDVSQIGSVIEQIPSWEVIPPQWQCLPEVYTYHSRRSEMTTVTFTTQSAGTVL